MATRSNKNSKNTLRTVSLVALLVAGSFVVLSTVTLPSNDLTFTSIQNFGHFVLFAILGWIVLRLFLALMSPRWISPLVISTICLGSLGLGTELFQKNMSDRFASVSDLALDAAGMIAGFLIVWAVGLWRARSRVMSALIIAVTLSVTLVSARSMIGFIGFDVFRASLPIVRDFHRPFSAIKVQVYGGAEFKKVRMERSGADLDSALRVRFSTPRYSGIVFLEPGSQWSAYENLSINIFSALPTSRQIELRIHDTQHNNRYFDRYNGSFSISPGLNELRIPLSSIAAMGENTESTREMDIDDVSQIQFFVRSIDTPFALDFLKIELL